LRNERDVATQREHVQRADVAAAQQDRFPVWVGEPVEQSKQRGLLRARRADDRAGAGRDLAAGAREDLACGACHVHVIEREQ